MPQSVFRAWCSIAKVPPSYVYLPNVTPCLSCPLHLDNPFNRRTFCHLESGKSFYRNKQDYWGKFSFIYVAKRYPYCFELSHNSSIDCLGSCPSKSATTVGATNSTSMGSFWALKYIEAQAGCSLRQDSWMNQFEGRTNHASYLWKMEGAVPLDYFQMTELMLSWEDAVIG